MTAAPDCRPELLHAYLDGELELTEALSVEEHAHGCGTCRAEMRGLVAVRRALRQALPAPRAPAALRARVADIVATGGAGVDAPPAPPSRARRAGGALLAAAAGLSLAAGGLFAADRFLPARDDALPALRPTALVPSLEDLADTNAEPVAEVVDPGDDEVAKLLHERAHLPEHPVAPAEAERVSARVLPAPGAPEDLYRDDARHDDGDGDAYGAVTPASATLVGHPDRAATGDEGEGVEVDDVGAGDPTRAGRDLVGEIVYSYRGYRVRVVTFDTVSTPVRLSGTTVTVGGRDALIDRVGLETVVYYTAGWQGYLVFSTMPPEMLIKFVRDTRTMRHP